MKLRCLALPAAVACAAVALASVADCGGVTAQPAGADAGADGTTTQHDASSGLDGAMGGDAGADTSPGCNGFSCDSGHVPLTPCPASPPAGGSSCTKPGEVCEYGSSWFMECNLVVVCQGGQWFVQSDGTQCSWLDGGGACPATWDEARAIDASPGTCPFASCTYPEGFCGCGVSCGGGGAPRPLDLKGIFVCIEAGAACPEPRPLSGTPCVGDAGCMYGWGCGCGQSEQCVDGVWQARPIPPCP